MITKEQAITANEFHLDECVEHIGPRGGVKRTQIVCRRNGRTKTWVTRPDEFRVPIKHGLRDAGYIDETKADRFHTAADCPLS